jgi:hypothetical protein
MNQESQKFLPKNTFADKIANSAIKANKLHNADQDLERFSQEDIYMAVRHKMSYKENTKIREEVSRMLDYDKENNQEIGREYLVYSILTASKLLKNKNISVMPENIADLLGISINSFLHYKKNIKQEIHKLKKINNNEDLKLILMFYPNHEFIEDRHIGLVRNYLKENWLNDYKNLKLTNVVCCDCEYINNHNQILVEAVDNNDDVKYVVIGLDTGTKSEYYEDFSAAKERWNQQDTRYKNEYKFFR